MFLFYLLFSNSYFVLFRVGVSCRFLYSIVIDMLATSAGEEGANFSVRRQTYVLEFQNGVIVHLLPDFYFMYVCPTNEF